MILDKGFCTVYSATNIAPAGDKPMQGLSVKYQSWYGELEFSTVPKDAELQEDVEISARIRIIQNKQISNHDVVVLSSELPPPQDSIQLEIVRAFHGTDSESGELISDLTLRKVEQLYDIAGIP